MTSGTSETDPLNTDLVLSDPKFRGSRIIFATHGRTAGHWLVSALNHHPEFFATLSVFTVCKFGEKTDEYREREQAATAEVLANPSMGLDEYFDTMARFEQARHLASVHRYQVSSLPARLAASNSNEPYIVVNLTRHPVVRMRSFARQRFARLSLDPIPPHVLSQTKNTLKQGKVRNLRRKLKRVAGVDVEDFAVQAFLCAVWTIYVEQGELSVPCWHIPSERLGSDPDYFRSILASITAGRSELPDHYIDKVFSQDKVAAMASDKDRSVRDDARESYDKMEPWEQFIVRDLAEELDFKSAYERFGYDFSFLSR